MTVNTTEEFIQFLASPGLVIKLNSVGERAETKYVWVRKAKRSSEIKLHIFFFSQGELEN